MLLISISNYIDYIINSSIIITSIIGQYDSFFEEILHVHDSLALVIRDRLVILSHKLRNSKKD